MQVRLKVLKGSKEGREIKLPKPQCLVGRSSECHLRSQIDAISSRHCVITTSDNEVVVRDLKSLNGTYVNGEKVADAAVLRCGDQLRIGPLVFEVVIESAEANRPKEVAAGTAGGNANLSTLIVESARRLRRSDAPPVSDAEPSLDVSPSAGDKESPELESGQMIVISGGILQGATGSIVKRVDGGQYLVALGGQEGRIWLRIPAHLLRAT